MSRPKKCYTLEETVSIVTNMDSVSEFDILDQDLGANINVDVTEEPYKYIEREDLVWQPSTEYNEPSYNLVAQVEDIFGPRM